MLACRELVSLSLPSLSPLATLRVAHVFPHVIHFLLTVLIKLTLCSSEVENNSLSQLHRIIQRDQIYEAILASPNFVLDLHNLFDDLPEPEAPSCQNTIFKFPNTVYIGFCDQPPSQGSWSQNPMEVAKSSGFLLGIVTR